MEDDEFLFKKPISVTIGLLSSVSMVKQELGQHICYTSGFKAFSKRHTKNSTLIRKINGQVPRSYINQKKLHTTVRIVT